MNDFARTTRDTMKKMIYEETNKKNCNTEALYELNKELNRTKLKQDEIKKVATNSRM